MLFGVVKFVVVAHLESLFQNPWYTMIERDDTTLPVVVLSAQSEAVEEEAIHTKYSL